MRSQRQHKVCFPSSALRIHLTYTCVEIDWPVQSVGWFDGGWVIMGSCIWSGVLKNDSQRREFTQRRGEWAWKCLSHTSQKTRNRLIILHYLLRWSRLRRHKLLGWNTDTLSVLEIRLSRLGVSRSISHDLGRADYILVLHLSWLRVSFTNRHVDTRAMMYLAHSIPCLVLRWVLPFSLLDIWTFWFAGGGDCLWIQRTAMMAWTSAVPRVWWSTVLSNLFLALPKQSTVHPCYHLSCALGAFIVTVNQKVPTAGYSPGPRQGLLTLNNHFAALFETHVSSTCTSPRWLDAESLEYIIAAITC